MTTHGEFMEMPACSHFSHTPRGDSASPASSALIILYGAANSPSTAG